ncbi:acyl-CoA dehydrogenase family protein [Paraburkholderia susongensis]|uniref:Acyl-CoA dehydrogenase n=1 Tax=Paraburkholderia susongensis TaxID=1515439 RepID=A0A1X7M1W1_9BURK|nr:acyl-CoA dehydrogenase family protein [Paraburkholderia susongensis]SMG59523.1 Acyl-CoA dehydrogenase [Paraburkholderia susongensis]
MPLNACNHPLVQLAPEEAELLARVRQLVAGQIGPDAARVAREDVFAWETFRLLCAEGVVATAFPREYGGTDASMLLRVRIIEELASACSTSASLITGTDLSSRPILAGGSESLKRELVPDLANGTQQAAFALTEPGAGSDVARLAARYAPADGGVIINGRKKFITRASVADVFVVVAREDAGPEGSKGLSAFVVPRAAPGVTVSADIPKLGWHGVPIAMVDFENVHVPRGALLGREGEGMRLAQDTLLRARIGHAAIALGRACGALLIASQYANQRKVFGQSVGSHQGIQWMVAQMAARIEAARCLVYSTAQRYDRGDADVAAHASVAKMHVTDLCMNIVVDCLQLLGGNGYLKAYPLERFLRDAKMNQIGEGTSEIHKTLIGRYVLGMAAQMPQHPCLDFEPDLHCHD